MEKKKLDGNNTKIATYCFEQILDATLHKTIVVRPPTSRLTNHPSYRTRQMRHCWRSKDEFINHVHLWTPKHGCAIVGQPAKTYIHQFCEDTGCRLEDLPRKLDDGADGQKESGIPFCQRDDDDIKDILMLI